MPYVDLSFRVQGSSIPRDHGYTLLSAISWVLPDVHSNPKLGILPISGLPAQKGMTAITERSRLVIRLPSEVISVILPLAGKKLDLDGHKIMLGIPQVFMLKPKSALHSRIVTIKGFMEPEPFKEAITRQLETLNIKGRFELGPRRVLHIKDKTVVGFALAVHELAVDESLTLQEQGIGGRRRMGCGIFLPMRG